MMRSHNCWAEEMRLRHFDVNVCRETMPIRACSGNLPTTASSVRTEALMFHFELLNLAWSSVYNRCSISGTDNFKKKKKIFMRCSSESVVDAVVLAHDPLSFPPQCTSASLLTVGTCVSLLGWGGSL